MISNIISYVSPLTLFQTSKASGKRFQEHGRQSPRQWQVPPLRGDDVDGVGGPGGAGAPRVVSSLSILRTT